ncbi:hypothetical protein RND71_000151 [Anisodus tanguticus]|uniref:SKP1-like protein n=1 Tax=Anisodus tanguticus TaxID=243964 RepID=A0AAE1SYJ6_9SOLA|nr:hypothetical protein RND71_000151 [Anisodus tanguticus]
MSTSKNIVLKSSDGESFEVDESVALESQTIKHMIEDDCANTSIPLPNVTSKILAKVIEYCKRHVDAAAAAKTDDKVSEDDLKTFDADFVKVDQGTLFDLILVWFGILNPIQIDFFTTFIIIITYSNLAARTNRTGLITLQAANYLNIKSLLDLTCQTVADMIKGKTPEEIRKTFNIKNDFTPEEEEEVRRENAWAFE